MNHSGTKKLETDRLILRKFELNDYIKAFENYCNDEKVTKYMTWNPHESNALTKDLISNWVSNYSDNQYYQWVITLKGINEAIGSISVVSINEELSEVEIGYCIGYNYWNQGIVTEATSKVIEYLFNEVKVKSIIAKHDSRNEASGRVMQKCNMMYYGQESGTNKGEDISLNVYKISVEEFNN